MRAHGGTCGAAEQRRGDGGAVGVSFMCLFNDTGAAPHMTEVWILQPGGAASVVSLDGSVFSVTFSQINATFNCEAQTHKPLCLDDRIIKLE